MVDKVCLYQISSFGLNYFQHIANKNKIIPKLFKLYNLISNKIPRHTEDLEFVDDLTKDLESSPHHRASKLELEHCNKLWKKYKK